MRILLVSEYNVSQFPNTSFRTQRSSFRILVSEVSEYNVLVSEYNVHPQQVVGTPVLVETLWTVAWFSKGSKANSPAGCPAGRAEGGGVEGCV